MLNSFEIAQLFAAQNQQFMQQNTFAHNIGIAPPQASLAGFGGVGNPPPFAPGIAPQFSFAPSGFMGPSYGGGNKLAAWGMGAMSAAPMAAGIGLGVMSSMQRFAGMAPFVDPLAGGMAGWASGGVMGAVRGAALPLGLGLAGGALAGAIINPMIAGGVQQNTLNAGLGQFQFFNSQSRSGMGFSRQDSSAIGEQVRSLAQIPEMMSSMEELTRLIPKLRQNGMMQGVRNATEFASRFKEALSTIRDMSRVFGTTLEDAEQFFSHSRSVGFFGRGDQMKNAMNAQLTSGLTGMNMGQVMQLQQAGANMSFSMGANKQVGARAFTTLAQNLGLAQSTGLIGPNAIENATGLTGPEAIESLTMQMGGVAMQLGQTSVGRSMMAGLTKFDGSGRAIGLDDDLLRRLNSGAMSIEELKSRGMAIKGHKMASFTRNQAMLSSELAAKGGPGAMATVMTGAVHGDEDKATIMLMRSGLTESQASLAMNLRGVGAGAEGNQMMDIRMREALMREQTDPDAMWKKFKTKVANIFTNPQEGRGAKLFNIMGKAFEDTIDEVFGRFTVHKTEQVSKALEAALVSGKTKNLSDMENSLSRISPSSQGMMTRFGNVISDLYSPGASLFGGIVDGNGKITSGRSSMAQAFVNMRRGYSTMENDGLTPEMKMASGAINNIKGSIGGFLGMSMEVRNDAMIGKLANMVQNSDLLNSNEKSALLGGGDPFKTGGNTIARAREYLGGVGGVYELIERVGGKNSEFGSVLGAMLSGKNRNRSVLQNAALAGNGINKSLDINMAGGMDQYSDARFRAQERTRAEKELASATGSDTILSLVKNDPQARKILSGVAANATSADKIMDQLSPELREAVMQIRGLSSTKREEVAQALSTLDLAEKGEGIEFLKRDFKEAAESFHSAVSSTKGLTANSMKVLNRVEEAFKKASNSPTAGAPELKAALAAMAVQSGKDHNILNVGAFGSAISGVKAKMSRLHGSESLGDLAKMFNMSEEALFDATGFASTVSMTKENRAKLLAAVTPYAMSGQSGKDGAYSDYNKELVDSLKEITKTQQYMQTGLVALYKEKGIDLNLGKENNAKPDGTPKKG